MAELSLGQLFELGLAKAIVGDPNVRISGIRHDSRRCEPGDLFVAVAGAHPFTRQVVGPVLHAECGRAGVVVEQEDVHAAPPINELPADGPHVPANLRETLNQVKSEQVQDLMDSIGATGRIDVDCADSTDFITSVADEILADVLVIGRSMDDSLIGRLRTHSMNLIRESPCPVISI